MTMPSLDPEDSPLIPAEPTKASEPSATETPLLFDGEQSSPEGSVPRGDTSGFSDPEPAADGWSLIAMVPDVGRSRRPM